MKKLPSHLKRLAYKISFEPLKEIDEETSDLKYQLLQDANNSKRGIVEKLKKYVADHPNDPVYKNYLYVAYKTQGRNEEARDILQKTIDQHPDYLFGKLNLAGEYLYAEEYEKVPKILGEFMEIKALYPERDEFHLTEVMSFFRIAVHYFINIEEWEQAKVRLEMMEQIDPEDPGIENMNKKLTAKILAANVEQMRADLEKEISVDTYPKVEYPAAKVAPALQHELLRVFYTHATEDFSTKWIDQIMALPRETLIQDLELIIEDASRRYDWFYNKYEEFVYEEQEFSVHALYFLAALNARESLPVVLNLLRQGKERVEYWFSDSLEELFIEPLYLLGESQLALLKEFVLESHLFSMSRLLISKVVAQIVFHQPDRREEVITWFREVFQYHLDHPEEDGIIDTQFIGWTVYETVEASLIELSPLIKKLWDKGWIPETYMGSLDVIFNLLKSPIEDYNKMPMPENIYEFYSAEYLDRRVERKFTEEEIEASRRLLARMQEDDPMMDSFIEILSGDFPEDERSNSKPRTVIAKPKVGRNEPCPCGSGKKYKKCCLNK